VYRPLPDGITIKESDVQGLGLFATKDFAPDTVLGIVHVMNKNFPHGSIRTALGAFYNHADDPNCKNVSGFWHQLPVKYLVTIKDIKAGDELTARYTLYNDFTDQWE
jgi:SET domain-containing protein